MHLSRKVSSALVARSSITVHDAVETGEEDLLQGNAMSLDAAIVWERKSSGYRIVDLRLNRFMQALRFVLDHFCYLEPLCKAVHLFEDVASIRACLTIILNKMHEMLSFCALQEGSQDIVGVLIASRLDRNQGELKFKPSQGDALYQIAMLKYYAITEAQFYEMVDAEKLIHIDVLCVNPTNQKEGIGTALVRSCVSRAIKINSGCVGEFSCDAAQTIAERLGFEIYSEIPYKFMGWLNRKFEIFETCQTKNYSLVCIALAPPVPRIPSIVIPTVTVAKASSKKHGKTNGKKKKVKKR